MRSIVIALFIFACTTSCAQSDVSKVEWLTGTWMRTNAKPGRSGVEVWTKSNPVELKGKGINLKGADTTFVEKIRIVAKDGKLFYVADVPENKGEVWFEFTSVSDKGFVCENPKHDFPKKIAYQVEGNSLKATISGDGKSVEYFFVKSN